MNCDTEIKEDIQAFYSVLEITLHWRYFTSMPRYFRNKKTLKKLTANNAIKEYFMSLDSYQNAKSSEFLKKYSCA